MNFGLKCLCLSFALVLLLCASEGAMSVANSLEPGSASDDLVIHIQSAVSSIQGDEPFIVDVSVDNQTGCDWRLKYYPVFILREAKGPQETVAMPEDAFFSRFRPEPNSEFSKKDVLAKGEKIRFEVDLTKLKWGQVRSAFQPDDRIAEAVTKGDYVLYLELHVASGDEKEKDKVAFSNQLSLTLK